VGLKDCNGIRSMRIIIHHNLERDHKEDEGAEAERRI
jgi:hypothetical protein